MVRWRSFSPKDFSSPEILLGGQDDCDMYLDSGSDFNTSNKEGLIVTDVDPRAAIRNDASMIGEDIQLHGEIPPRAGSFFSARRQRMSTGRRS